jgi:peroxiredoxin
MSVVAAIEGALAEARAMDAPVNARLQLIADRVRILAPPFAEAVDRMVIRLQDANAGAHGPSVGAPMPSFLLPDEAGRLTTLEDLLAQGPAALAFHRGHWCPYCRLNTKALAEAQARLKRGRIVAITPDRQQFAATLKADAGAGFPILTDLDNGYALSLNIAVWVGEEMEQMMAGAGVDLPTYQGAASWIIPIPATFVVGTDGIIAARYIDPDYRRRFDIEALVAALEGAS